MDLDALLARAAQARAFTLTVGDWRITARAPTPFEERRLAIVAGDTPDAFQRWALEMGAAAITGWEGPTIGTLTGEADATPLPCTPATARALLEARLDVLDALTVAYRQQRDAREADAKN